MMAITAIHAKLSGMETVIECNRLGGLITDAGIFRRGVVSDPGGYCAANHSKGYDQLDWNEVRPTRKNVSHEVLSTSIQGKVGQN